jgi:hypothetical protein
MLIISDRVKESSLTTGSGVVVFDSAFGGFQSFQTGIGDGNTTYYCIENGVRWEVGQGVYTLSGDTLSRDVVFDSSAGGAKINLEGVSTVFCTLPADKAIIQNEASGTYVVDISTLELNSSGIISNTLSNSGDAVFGNDVLVSGDLTVVGSLFGVDDISSSGDIVSSGFLTLIRPNGDAGNFFHAYKEDGTEQTAALHFDGNASPMWKLGLKSNPTSQTAPPTFAYVFAKDGSAGMVSNTNNYASISDGIGFTVYHDTNTVFRASSLTGVYIETTSSANPSLVVTGPPAPITDLQRWSLYDDTILSVIDSGGKIGILNDNPLYELDVNGSGRMDELYLTSGIRFQDGTFQSTAGGGGGGGGGEATAVSGWASDTIASGDTAVSGYFQTYVDSQDHSAVSVSGWANTTFDLQGVTDRGSVTTSGITVSGVNLSSGSDSGILYRDGSGDVQTDGPTWDGTILSLEGEAGDAPVIRIRSDTTELCHLYFANGAYGSRGAISYYNGGTNASNYMLFNVGQDEHMRLTGEGKLGINDTTPDAMLDIVSAAATDVPLSLELAAAQSANAFQISSAGTSAGDLLRVASGGRLYVGTTNADGARATIRGDSSEPALFVQGDSARSGAGDIVMSLNRYGQSGGFQVFGDHHIEAEAATFAGAVLHAAGSKTLPAISFSASPTVGFFTVGSQVHFSDGGGGGANSLGFVGGMRLGSGGSVSWSSTVNSTDADDTRLSRDAANAVKVWNGTTLGTFQAGLLDVTAPAATDIPLSLELAAAQSANAFQISTTGTSAGDVFKVEADGATEIAGSHRFFANGQAHIGGVSQPSAGRSKVTGNFDVTGSSTILGNGWFSITGGSSAGITISTPSSSAPISIVPDGLLTLGNSTDGVAVTGNITARTTALTATDAADIPATITLASGHTGHILDINNDGGSGGDNLFLGSNGIHETTKHFILTSTGTSKTARLVAGKSGDAGTHYAQIQVKESNVFSANQFGTWLYAGNNGINLEDFTNIEQSLTVNASAITDVPITANLAAGQTGNFLNITSDGGSAGDKVRIYDSNGDTTIKLSNDGFIRGRGMAGSVGNGVVLGAVFPSFFAGNNGVGTAMDKPFGFSDNANLFTSAVTLDVAISRLAAGSMGLGTGAAGAIDGNLTLAGLNASYISATSTMGDATGNEIANTLSYTTNKLTSGDDTGLLISKTDTASPGTSLLLDCQVGGASKASIDDNGLVTADRLKIQQGSFHWFGSSASINYGFEVRDASSQNLVGLGEKVRFNKSVNVQFCTDADINTPDEWIGRNTSGGIDIGKDTTTVVATIAQDGYGIQVTASAITDVVATFTGAAGQTANITEWVPDGVTAGDAARITEIGDFSNNQGSTNNEVFGDGASASSGTTGTVVVGAGATTTGGGETIIGKGTTGHPFGSNTIVGAFGTCTNGRATGIGYSLSLGEKSVGIGYDVTAVANTIAIGYQIASLAGEARIDPSLTLTVGAVASSWTLSAATGNEVANTLAYTTNKLTSGDDTGLLVSKTDTASPGTSLLLDLQTDASSVFSVDDVGTVDATDGNFVGQLNVNNSLTAYEYAAEIRSHTSGGWAGWRCLGQSISGFCGALEYWSSTQLGSTEDAMIFGSFSAHNVVFSTNNTRRGGFHKTTGVFDAEYGISAVADAIGTIPITATGSVGQTASLGVFNNGSNDVLLVSPTGLMTVGDGTDADINLLQVNVTGSPLLHWDESTDRFQFTKGLHVGGGLYFDRPDGKDWYGFKNVSGRITVRANNADATVLGNDRIITTTGARIGWSSTAQASGSIVTAFTEISSGIVALGNGTASDKTGELRFATGEIQAIHQATEVTSLPTGTTQTITLDDNNHQTLDLTSTTGDTTVTLTVPSGSAAGTLIIEQHATTSRDITWAVSAGTFKWMGTEPTWSSDAVSAIRIVTWRYDGAVMYLAATDVAA